MAGGEQALVGIFMPTHGFTAPWLVIKSAWKMPRGNGAKGFCVATRAGMKIGSWHTPGLAGTASFLIALILSFKGYKVRGVLDLDMPSNWMSLHTGLNAPTVASICSRGKQTSEVFVKDILAGHHRWININNLYDLLFGLALVPLSLGYLIAGRVALAKIFFATNNCNSCGICVKHCPVEGVELRGSGKRPFWTYKCESCMRCMAWCPHQAIEASQSLMLIFIFFFSMPVAHWIIQHIAPYWPGTFYPSNYWLLRLLDTVLWLLLIIFGYRLFHFLQRYKSVNTIFKYTTPTFLFRRYHEPETKLRDLVSRK